MTFTQPESVLLSHPVFIKERYEVLSVQSGDPSVLVACYPDLLNDFSKRPLISLQRDRLQVSLHIATATQRPRPYFSLIRAPGHFLIEEIHERFI